MTATDFGWILLLVVVSLAIAASVRFDLLRELWRSTWSAPENEPARERPAPSAPESPSPHHHVATARKPAFHRSGRRG